MYIYMIDRMHVVFFLFAFSFFSIAFLIVYISSAFCIIGREGGETIRKIYLHIRLSLDITVNYHFV
jgi:hypothetical protein